jgi:GTP-binding protein HflX
MLKAILIDCIKPSITAEEAAYRLDEAENLIKTYGGVVLVKKIQKRLIPTYKTFIGSGKIEELINIGNTLSANILIINNELKPTQTYNLSEIFRPHDIAVWDRIDLILKIFQKHAATREARLEIELAAIKHMGPRIFGMGMQLSRQGGGIGTKGVGETNIEFMKRHLAKLAFRILKELAECKRVRKLHRASRRRQRFKTVGIIGYTNAGKSSLLNALTKKGAYVADKLFATLDTRVGKMFLKADQYPAETGHSAKNRDTILTYFPITNKPNSNPPLKTPPQSKVAPQLKATPPPLEILIADTIGFIQDLPPTLIKSFRSTLEETVEADILLHVIDIADPKMDRKIKVVNEILGQIDSFRKPCIYVFNKTDLLPQKIMDPIKKNLRKIYNNFTPCFVSTYNGDGLATLKQEISRRLLIS